MPLRFLPLTRVFGSVHSDSVHSDSCLLVAIFCCHIPVLVALDEDGIQLSFVDGLVVKDLVVRPESINRLLAENDTDLRVVGGQIGSLSMSYTAMPGVVTVQLQDVDIRVQPNALRTIGRTLKNKITDLVTAVPEDPPMRDYPMPFDPRCAHLDQYRREPMMPLPVCGDARCRNPVCQRPMFIHPNHHAAYAYGPHPQGPSPNLHGPSPHLHGPSPNLHGSSPHLHGPSPHPHGAHGPGPHCPNPAMGLGPHRCFPQEPCTHYGALPGRPRKASPALCCNVNSGYEDLHEAPPRAVFSPPALASSHDPYGPGPNLRDHRDHHQDRRRDLRYAEDSSFGREREDYRQGGHGSRKHRVRHGLQRRERRYTLEREPLRPAVTHQVDYVQVDDAPNQTHSRIMSQPLRYMPPSAITAVPATTTSATTTSPTAAGPTTPVARTTSFGPTTTTFAPASLSNSQPSTLLYVERRSPRSIDPQPPVPPPPGSLVQ
ncbi:hypothetical protein GNI_160220 [Gregarina niphandrodes]|uniref:Uncharacterized protein n=1 Tax=Gregarina niphandrodes TaxID=110365 RepID=A0A023AYL3_GRENI|nr:hypothetical protein GNI_160220 [Gregarina niphandrodes]EZG43757.1 hypothetical protein GNI_160220 [Gregarina niphandrodes]|eukprot:XP_011134628.1 hypothetical protein GNI_160220 [Gregarina niphandrodes]